MKSLTLAFQVVLSLGLVLVLMWLLARALRGSVMARGAGVVELLARLPMTRGSSVAVVRVADQVLVLGVSETQVTVLTMADPDQMRGLTSIAGGASAPRKMSDRLRLLRSRPEGAAGPLTGSIFSPDTWQRAISALRERTVRR